MGGGPRVIVNFPLVSLCPRVCWWVVHKCDDDDARSTCTPVEKTHAPPRTHRQSSWPEGAVIGGSVTPSGTDRALVCLFVKSLLFTCEVS